MRAAFHLQAATRGKQATVAEWKAARQALQDALDALIADAGPKERERLLATLDGVCSGRGSRGAGDLEGAPSTSLSAASRPRGACGKVYTLLRKPDKLDGAVSSAPPVSMSAGGERRRGRPSKTAWKESRRVADLEGDAKQHSTPKRRERHGHTHASRLARQAPAKRQRYFGRASGKTLTSEMTREEKKLVNELQLFEQLQARHQATAPQDDCEDEIEDWAQCERCKKWRKLGVCAAPNTKSGSVTESIPAAEVVGISEFDLSSSNFVCKMAGDVTCDMPEDISWVLLPAFDPYEETPTLKLCLSALEQLTFKIPEKGYLRKVGIDMQGSMLQEIRKTPAQVHEVGNLLKRVVSFIDKRFLKNRWMMQWQQGWEEAIDEATCADTVYDAGIKIEKSGIDWNQLQILRKETQGKATGRISAASFDTSSAPPSSAAGCRSRVSPQTALAMTKSKEGQAQIHDMIDDMFGGYVAGGVTEMREKEEVAAKKQREEQAAATARSDGETLEGGTSSMSSGGKARRNKKLEKEAFNWARKFERLKRFQIKHGHVQVKKSSPDDQVPPN